jgi:anthranilate synthase component 1
MTSTSPRYRRVPIVHETLADLDTPLSVYLKLANGPYSYLLESAQNAGDAGAKWGRYSIIGLPARTIIKVRGPLVEVICDGVVTESIQTDDPLTFVEEFQQRFDVENVAGLPRFFGGLVGYFGYDTVRYVEPRLAKSAPQDTLDTPDIMLMVSEEVVVFDNIRGRMQLIGLVDPEQDGAAEAMQNRLQQHAEQLQLPIQGLETGGANASIEESDFVSEFGEAAFQEAVEKIREYTRAGDVMQVVLAQRMSIPFQAPAVDLYRALRSLNPSPYMYLMHLDEFQIVSSSPEILARLENGVITNRPLAGTRRRGHNDAEDLALEAELKADPKEIAEHLMLIDLGRNDVGRVSAPGTVEVTEQFVIERYSHVMHLSSNVNGSLEPGKTAMDVLRATLPVGTLSGAEGQGYGDH